MIAAVNHPSRSARRVHASRSYERFFGATLEAEERRTWVIIFFVTIALVLDAVLPYVRPLLYAAAIIGVVPTAIEAYRSTGEAKISIDTFNTFAVAASLLAQQPRSSAFIDLMLLSATLLDIFTTQRSNSATEKLLRMKPTKAVRETKAGALEEVRVEDVKVGDTIVVKNGAQAPVDGIVIFGDASFNEASLTGESALARKQTGDRVASGTVNESGAVKLRATAVGKNSTIERMASLITDASK